MAVPPAAANRTDLSHLPYVPTLHLSRLRNLLHIVMRASPYTGLIWRSNMVRKSGLLFAAVLTAAGVANADVITDAAGDFLSTLSPAAPRAGDLDVISTSVMLQGSNLLFSATLNAPINTTPDAFYVWGVDRGTRPSPGNFASLGLPNIIFDAVVVIQNEGTGVVNDLTGVNPPFTLSAGSVTSAGNTIDAVVPLSALPSR